MTKLYFSEMNNLTNAHNDLEPEKCQLNYNFDTKNLDKDRGSQSKCEPHQIRQRKYKCGTIPSIVSGLIFLSMGFFSTKLTITDMILTERIKMQSWFPSYKLWVEPEPEVRLNTYIFAVENANEFLSGTDSKIKLKQIGPIVYREHLQNQDIVRHDNSTLSYTAHRWAEFLPHANKPGILNETITVPHYGVLAAASFANEHNYLVQIGYNFLHRRYSDGLFINITIYDYLWNFRSKLLEKAWEVVPSMIPILNCGALDVIYTNGPDRYNVKIGTKYGDSEFFQINTINGAPTVPGYNVKRGDCYASVANSSEGVAYRQRVTKEDVLTFWRRALCRKVDLHFEKELLIHDVLSYKYTLGPDVYDRNPNNETDCYKGAYGDLPNGLTDVSKCYYDMPLAESQPHFYGRSAEFTKKFEGLNANEETHSSFSIVEPKLGFPMKQAARSQMNLVIPKFSSFFEKDYHLFSDMVLPLFWIEVLQNDLTTEIVWLVGLVANVAPIIEVTLTFILYFIGFVLILTVIVRAFKSKWNHLATSKQINFPFVKRSSKTRDNYDNFN
ncbi:platelet glycoprotein 4-like [Bradysia coprophila]|uniref:platelet glycoprotein 4-like n=1 Tax=Bradysia coprophila TaxID=38358 RepID=UPI00187DD425|nr:platelet glycoprotein 4-like [Bradysia coprophila]